MHEQWWLHCTSQWGQYTSLSEHVYCVAIRFKMTEQVEQRICIKFCMNLVAMGNWWLAASSWQHACSCITSHAEFFGETSNPPGDSDPLQPRFCALWLLDFPKTKITLEREEISDCPWDLGKYDGAADGNWENCEVPRCLLWKGLRHLCPMYSVSYILYLLQ